MYICVCKAVTDKAIRNLVADGACSMRELKQCLGVGSQSGKCTPAAQDLLNRSLTEQMRIPCQMVEQRPAA